MAEKLTRNGQQMGVVPKKIKGGNKTAFDDITNWLSLYELIGLFSERRMKSTWLRNRKNDYGMRMKNYLNDKQQLVEERKVC